MPCHLPSTRVSKCLEWKKGGIVFGMIPSAPCGLGGYHHAPGTWRMWIAVIIPWDCLHPSRDDSSCLSHWGVFWVTLKGCPCASIKITRCRDVSDISSEELDSTNYRSTKSADDKWVASPSICSGDLYIPWVGGEGPFYFLFCCSIQGLESTS